MLKELIILLGSPGSGKDELSNLIVSHFGDTAEYISWKKISKESNIDTSTIDENSMVIISEKMKRLITESRKRKFIVSGFGLRENEAQQIIDWVSDGSIKIGCVAEINCSLNHIISRNKEEDPLLIRKDYLVWHRNKKLVKKILNRRSESYFDIDGNVENSEIFARFISNYYTKKKTTRLYKRVAETDLKTKFGMFRFIAYQSSVDYSYHLCLVKGDVRDRASVVCRLHSSCITGDILHSMHCDCGRQLELALDKISKCDYGIFIYMFQEGRGINIINKIKAYDLQWKGFDTVDANIELGLSDEMRTYEAAADIIDDLNVGSILLMSNNPDKYNKLSELGVPVEGMISHYTESNGFDLRYLNTKKKRMNHNMGLKVFIGTLSDAKNKYVRDSFSERGGSIDFVSCDVPSGVSDQPFGEDVELGAKNRARAAYDSGDTIAEKIGIGLEGGLIDHDDGLYMVCISVLYDGLNYMVGKSSEIKIPKQVADRIKVGDQFGEAIREYQPVDSDETKIVGELISREGSFKKSLDEAMSKYCF